jgi:hypothetical protein
VEHREAHAVESEALIPMDRVPRDVALDQPGEEPGVQRIADRSARLEHLAHGKSVEQRGDASDVVEVGVGDDHRRDGPRTMPLQERRHHPRACVAPIRSWARVDDDPPAPGGSHHGPIALPDVEKM